MESAPAVRIPKILHIVWVGPHRPPTEMIESWARKHTNGWFFTLWQQHQSDWVNQEQIDVRAARDEWNGVADVMRYEILYRYGGFVVDADSECLQPLDSPGADFLEQTCALAAYENEAVRPGIIGCGFLAGPKGSPFFAECIHEAAAQDPRELAWKTVGPLLMGRVAARMPNDIRVYPAKMFNPVHYSGAKAPGGPEVPVYAQQGWGSTKGYNALRKLPCQCPKCWVSMFNAPWA